MAWAASECPALDTRKLTLFQGPPHEPVEAEMSSTKGEQAPIDAGADRNIRGVRGLLVSVKPLPNWLIMLQAVQFSKYVLGSTNVVGVELG